MQRIRDPELPAQYTLVFYLVEIVCVLLEGAVFMEIRKIL